MAKTGKVTAKPAARTRFFLSIKRERKLAAPRRESLSGSTRRGRAPPSCTSAAQAAAPGRESSSPVTDRESLSGSTRSYMDSGAVTLNSARPFSSTVRVAVHRYSRAACRASSLPLTRQAL